VRAQRGFLHERSRPALADADHRRLGDRALPGEVPPTVDFQVFVLRPARGIQDAWRAKGAQWVDGMPDDAVLAFQARRPTA
jgi:hypothetical protein